LLKENGGLVMTFGKKLLKVRMKQNLSQTELAEKIGVSERSIYNYEQAGVLPRRPILIKLAEVLNVSMSYLLDDEETDTRKNIGEELFIANARNEFGNKGAREALEVLDKASALFAGGELNEDAKDIFFQSIMEVYMESKAEAREKFSPKRRVSRQK
jgi:transcriptional regulator with XRE-family HTH domain